MISNSNAPTAAVRQWPFHPADLPWLDQPDAFRKIESLHQRQAVNVAQAALLQKWAADGYVILEKAIPEADIDLFNREFDGLWQNDRPAQELVFEGISCRDNEPQRSMSHADVLALDEATRSAMRDRSFWRIHGLQQYTEGARRIFSNRALQQTAGLILGKPAEPSYSITFFRGSCQDLHQDASVFHIYPRNYLVGVWIALEDVAPDAGPLIFYPGSHRGHDLFPEYANYPQTNLHTATPEGSERYQAYVRELSGRYEKHRFLARKGDVLLWHAMLIHGGEKVLAPERTRRSFVVHYVGERCNVHDQIQGPFLW